MFQNDNNLATMAISIQADYKDSLDDWFQIGTLRHWQACVFSNKYGRWSDGKDARSFWNFLYRHACLFRYLQVWGWDMWRSWCVLGGTKEITDGRITLDLTSDCFVAADTPTIITCKIPGTSRKGKAVWADLGNLGIAKEDYGITDSRAELPAAKMAILAYRRMCRKHNLGKPCLTAASQAWQVFTDRYEMPQHSSAAIIPLEEAAYFGGYCGCRRLGEINEPLWHLDISSMYTAIGLNTLFPVRYEGFSEREPVPDASKNLLEIADVTLTTNQPFYPARESVKLNGLARPQASCYGERVIYPVGTFRTVLCSPELDIARSFGHVKKRHRSQYYKAAPLMNQWSEWALKARKEVLADAYLGVLGKCFKSIINSLPGKWCQHDSLWVNYPPYNGHVSEWHKEFARNPVTGVMTMFRTIAGQCQFLDKSELNEKCSPAVAAFWTSYGRALRLGIEQLLGADDLLYSDTDSFIVTKNGLDILGGKPGISTIAEPGRLRIVGMADTAHFYGIRKYSFGGEWHWAGVNPEEEESLGLEQQMHHGRVGIASQTVRRFDSPGWDKYKHGTVTEDGIVRPFVIGE